MEKHFSDAEALFRDAAEKQETKLATLVDPSGWWYPVRRSVAAALLAQGNYKAAMVEAKQALLHWPNDPVSLRILSDSETRLGYLEDAQSHLRLARSAWMTDIDALPLSFM
jgi:tetratricopeptide (TPR) repeat protein